MKAASPMHALSGKLLELVEAEIRSKRASHPEAIAALGNAMAALIAAYDDESKRRILLDVTSLAVVRAVDVILKAVNRPNATPNDFQF